MWAYRRNRGKIMLKCSDDCCVCCDYCVFYKDHFTQNDNELILAGDGICLFYEKETDAEFACNKFKCILY